MRPTVLVVYCHSNPHSYTRAVCDAVLAGLATQPCDVELVDLYADGFDPVLIVDAAHRRRDLDKVEATARYRAQLARLEAPPATCRACGQPLALADVPERWFAFLR